MNSFEFFSSLYGKAQSGFLSLWTLPDKRTAYFSAHDLAAACAYAESRFALHDVYFGVGLRKEALGDKKRGGNDDVVSVPAFWADIDVQNADAHAETELPPTIDAALEFLGGLPLKPSIVVSSGHGLHVYWQFAEPLTIMTAAHRDNIAAALRGWQTFVNNAAKERGWKLDNTSDLSRVLRVPGGINHKAGGTGLRAEVLSVDEVRYSPSDFTPYLPAKAVAAKPTAQSDTDNGFSGKVGGGQKLIDKCAFIRHCRDNAATLTEPQWYALVSNLALCSDGAELCHAFSKAYQGYKQRETDGKIAHAKQAAKPHTCRYIRDSLCFDCGDCDAGCKSPVGLAVVTRADEVRELLEAEITDASKVFDDEFVSALSYAKAKMPGEYAKFKMKLKGKVNLVDLEKCVKASDERKRRHSVTEGEPLTLDGIDLGGAVIPAKWQVTEQGGVRRAYTGKDGEVEVIACPTPVVITRRLVNIDEGKERLELSFKRDHHWKTVIANRTTVYNKASIIGLGDEGLHVTSSTAGELVNYLSDYEIANNAVIPRVSSISRLGWLDDGQFFPYAVDEEIVFEEDKGTATLYRNLTECGDYGVWKSMMVKLRGNPISRFITSAGFAAPLLAKIGVRTFVIHLWHTSGSGKSAALKAAISIWGNPLRIMGNGFTTMVGAEQLAGTLRNLPFGIDEKQAADERRLSLEQLIYILGQGSGKIRGARGGGNQEVATWHNIVMLTGEEPITKSSSLDGIQTRTFELYGKPVDDMDFAKEVHVLSENNYGFAGAAFMRAVCGMLRENPDSLRREYTALLGELTAKGLKNIHVDYVAAVALGDVLAETLIFGTDTETARRDALANAEAIFRLNESQLATDAVERAWEFITEWLVSNDQRFSYDATPCYGRMEESPGKQYTVCYVIPLYLDEALEKAGFNVKKTFQGLRDRGLVAIETDSDGKQRTKTRATIGGKVVRCYEFHLTTNRKEPDIEPLCGSIRGDGLEQ